MKIRIVFAVIIVFWGACRHSLTVEISYLPNPPTDQTVVYGRMETQTTQEGTPTLLNANCYTAEGFSFLGWTETPDGDVIYADRAEVRVSVFGLKLYAVWKEDRAAEETMPSRMSFTDWAADSDAVIFEIVYTGPEAASFEATVSPDESVNLSLEGQKVVLSNPESTDYLFTVTAKNKEGQILISAAHSVTVAAAEPDESSVLKSVSFLTPFDGVLAAACGSGKAQIAVKLNPENAVVTNVSVSDGGQFLPSTYNVYTEGTLIFPPDDNYAVNRIFTLTYTTVGGRTVTAALKVKSFSPSPIPNTIIRGGQTYHLIKGFDFNDMQENGEMAAAAHDNGQPISFSVGIDADTDNGIISVSTAADKENGNRVYPLTVLQQAEYAEIRVRVENITTASVGIGLGVSKENDGRGWKDQFLTGLYNRFAIRSSSEDFDLSGRLTAGQWALIGIGFPTEEKSYFVDGIGVWSPRKTGYDLAAGFDGLYYLYIAQDQPGKNRADIDYIAFYGTR